MPDGRTGVCTACGAVLSTYALAEGEHHMRPVPQPIDGPADDEGRHPLYRLEECGPIEWEADNGES